MPDENQWGVRVLKKFFFNLFLSLELSDTWSIAGVLVSVYYIYWWIMNLIFHSPLFFYLFMYGFLGLFLPCLLMSFDRCLEAEIVLVRGGNFRGNSFLGYWNETSWSKKEMVSSFLFLLKRNYGSLDTWSLIEALNHHGKFIGFSSFFEDQSVL